VNRSSAYLDVVAERSLAYARRSRATA